jgi:hypothetical protein
VVAGGSRFRPLEAPTANRWINFNSFVGTHSQAKLDFRPERTNEAWKDVFFEQGEDMASHFMHVRAEGQYSTYGINT